MLADWTVVEVCSCPFFKAIPSELSCVWHDVIEIVAAKARAIA